MNVTAAVENGRMELLSDLKNDVGNWPFPVLTSMWYRWNCYSFDISPIRVIWVKTTNKWTSVVSKGKVSCILVFFWNVAKMPKSLTQCERKLEHNYVSISLGNCSSPKAPLFYWICTCYYTENNRTIKDNVVGTSSTIRFITANLERQFSHCRRFIRLKYFMLYN